MGRFLTFDKLIKSNTFSAISFIAFCGLLYVQRALEVMLFDNIPLTLLGITSIYAIGAKLSSTNNTIIRTLTIIGRESLPIYLTHYFFIFNLTSLVPFIESSESNAFGWEILIGSMSSALIILPTLFIIKVIKSNRILALLIYGEI